MSYDVSDFSGTPPIKISSRVADEQKAMSVIAHELFEKTINRKKEVFEHVLSRTPSPLHWGWGINAATEDMASNRPIRNTIVCVEVDLDNNTGVIFGWEWLDEVLKMPYKSHLDIKFFRLHLYPFDQNYPYRRGDEKF